MSHVPQPHASSSEAVELHAVTQPTPGHRPPGAWPTRNAMQQRSGEPMSLDEGAQTARASSRKQGAPKQAVPMTGDEQGFGTEVQHPAAGATPALLPAQHEEPGSPHGGGVQSNSSPSPSQHRSPALFFIVPSDVIAAAPHTARVKLQLDVHGTVQYTCKASAWCALWERVGLH